MSAQQQLSGLSSVLVSVVVAAAGILVAASSYHHTIRPHGELFTSIATTRKELPPEARRDKDVMSLLKAKGFADTRVVVQIVNQGNGPAETVRIKAKVHGSILSVSTAPSPQDSPVWVEFGQFDAKPGSRSVDVTLRNLGIKRILQMDIRYNRDTPVIPDSLDVCADGIPDTRVDDVAVVKEWSQWRLLSQPGFVIGIALLVGVLGWHIVLPRVRRRQRSDASTATLQATDQEDLLAGRDIEEASLPHTGERSARVVPGRADKPLVFLEGPTLVTAADKSSRILAPSTVLRGRSGTLAASVFVHRKGGIRSSVHSKYILAHCTHGGVMQQTPLGKKYLNVFAMYRDQDGHWRVWVASPTGDCEYLTLDDGSHMDGWHHLLVRWDHSRPLLEWFVDGERAVTSGNYMDCWPQVSDQPLYVGSWSNDTAGHFVETMLARVVGMEYWAEDDEVLELASSSRHLPQVV